jgi:hypothetical protein
MVHAGRHARNWGAYVAAGVALATIMAAALAIVLLSPHKAPESTGFEKYAAAQDKTWPHDPSCDGADDTHPVSALAKLQRSYNCDKNAENHREEERATFEAIRTADATQDAANMARRQAMIAAWTFGIVVVALGASLWAAYEASKAASAADATLDHARKSSEHELRAYIHADTFESIFPESLEATSTVFVQIGWKQLGQTPAKRCASDSNGAFFTGEPPEDFDFPDRDGQAGEDFFDLGPGQNMYTAGQTFSFAELMETGLTDKRLYIWGWIEYSDMFDGSPRRRTEFCCIGRLGTKPILQTPTVVFQTYRRHNAIDERCVKVAHT